MGAKAKKKPVAAPQSYDAANALLARYGDLEQQLTVSGATLAESVAKIKALVEETIGPMKAEQKAIAAQLEAFGDARRDELLAVGGGRAKFHDMPAGRIGWRTNPPSVEIKKGHKVDDVIAAIRELRLPRFLRRTWTLNKEAMLDDQDKANTVPGIKIKKGVEVFYFEPAGMDLSEGEP